MTTPVIIDVAIVVVLGLFCLMGIRRGLLRSLAGLVTTMMALVGAALIAATFTGPVTQLVSPMIEAQIEKKLDAALTEETPREDTDGQTEDLLALLGLDAEVRESLAEKVKDAVRDTGVSVVTAVVQSLAQSVIYGLLYILSFAGLTLLLHVLLKAMDLVLKLPGLHALNALGGGLIGFAEGVLLLFLVVWVLRRLGVSFEAEALAEAHILRIFTTNTPLSVLAFLQ